MVDIRQKFVTRADPKILDEVRAIASREGKSFHAAVDEALRDYVNKKKQGTSRPAVLVAFGESLAERDTLYRELAK